MRIGDVNWVDQSDAVSQGLTYIDSNGHAIIKVDNTSNVVWNDKRNSVSVADVLVMRLYCHSTSQ